MVRRGSGGRGSATKHVCHGSLRLRQRNRCRRLRLCHIIALAGYPTLDHCAAIDGSTATATAALATAVALASLVAATFTAPLAPATPLAAPTTARARPLHQRLLGCLPLLRRGLHRPTLFAGSLAGASLDA